MQPRGAAATTRDDAANGGDSRDVAQDGGPDDEPMLKYQRMGADVGRLLTKFDRSGSTERESAADKSTRDTIVRMALHDSYLAFGTSTGTVLLTDYHGNETRRFRPHTKAVTDLSTDITGDFLASCSEDGTVVVTSLQPGSAGEQAAPEVYTYGARWPMLAVRLDPLYARRKDKTFVAGGAAGKLLLNKKGWLGHDEIVLHKGEGPVSAIAWRGSLVAWASDGGIKIMDVDKGKGGERISYVDKPRSVVDFDEHGCRCHMLWETPTRLLVGWGDTVMVLQILVRESRYQRIPPSDSPAAAPSSGQGTPSSGGVYGIGNGRRAPVSALTSPAGLPMAVIGNPSAVAPIGLEAPERYTQIVAVWQSDCLICGLSPFNDDTLVLLGYPVNEDAYSDEGQQEDAGGGIGDGEQAVAQDPASAWSEGDAAFQPEVQLVKRRNGELAPTPRPPHCGIAVGVLGDGHGLANQAIKSFAVNPLGLRLTKVFDAYVMSADTLPLRGWQRAGAADLLLRSTCWSVSSHRPDKDGASAVFYVPPASELSARVRGLPPATFILSPEDLIVARVRDIDDKISWALGKRDFVGAVNIALDQRQLLRRHDFQDLVAKHLENLMAKGNFQQAAAECPRLLGADATAWERWIYGFARRRRLSVVVPYVPTTDPRLPPSVYEVVLERLLLTDSRLFLETLRRWGHPRGKHGGLQGGLPTAERMAPGERAGTSRVDSLQALPEALPPQDLYSLPVLMARMEASLVRTPDPVIMEAQAEAYVMDRQFARAIRAYLSLAEHRALDLTDTRGDGQGPRGSVATGAQSGASRAPAPRTGGGGQEGAATKGQGGIAPGAGAGAGAAAGTGTGTGAEGGEYAHVFRMIEQHSLFDTVQFRVLQMIRLDREVTGELLLRHPDKFPVASVVAQLEGKRHLQHWYLGLLFDRSPELYGSQEFAPFHALQVSLLAEFAPQFERGRPPSYNSAFLRFLRSSGFAPLETALRECGKRRPPLYDEMAYILGRMGDTGRALTILLEEVRSVPRAIEFVEAHDKDLWYRLIEHSLKNEAFLSGLLDHAGVYDVDLPRLVAEIPKGMRIPGLRDKLVKIISDYHFQVRVNESCSASVKADLLRRLRRLNQGQRRATRVEPGVRCSYGMCLMPLSGPPGGLASTPGAERGLTATGRGWGRGRRRALGSHQGGRAAGNERGPGGGSHVFPCGHMFHEFCLGISREGGWRGSRGPGPGGAGGPPVCTLCSRGKPILR